MRIRIQTRNALNAIIIVGMVFYSLQVFAVHPNIYGDEPHIPTATQPTQQLPVPPWNPLDPPPSSLGATRDEISALDDAGIPIQVPQIIPESDEQKKRIEAGEKRQAHRLKLRKQSEITETEVSNG